MAVIRNTKSNKKIMGTSGNDIISSYGNKITIDGGYDNDFISNYGGSNVSISGGYGNDSITALLGSSNSSNGKKVTISGGIGDDQIASTNYKGTLFKYNFGDGNDLIEGFNSNDTLQINSSSYDTMTYGDNFVVFVGTGSIIL